MERKHRYLLVEDEEAHAELVRRAFETTAEVVVVDRVDRAHQALAGSKRFDLVLSDFMLPDGKGIEVVTECTEQGIPVVLLTSHGDESIAVDAMKAGAIDYVVKTPDSLSDMPHIAGRALREWGHIQEQKRLEGELLQAQKLEAIGQLSSGIAHDFNNILMAIMGCADLALRRLEPEDRAAEFVREIKSAAKRGSTLSSQLVTFSRKAESEDDGRVFDLNATVRQSRSLLQPLLGASINVRMELADEELPVCCHPSQFEQVIFNLVVNARDAMPMGGAITISTAHERVAPGDSVTREPGEYAVVSVSDTGVGMDKETLERVFEPFFTTKPVGKGTGLGLSTVYGIVRQGEGEITVDSEPGKGTTFVITIPMADEPIQTESSETEVEVTGGDEHILLVEDDRLVRLTLATYLRQVGYEVAEATDGHDALRWFREHGADVDLVISDVAMPGDVDGFEMVRQMRETRPELPVLFVSGHGSAPLHDDDVLTTEPFLTKPVEECELLQAVHAVLLHPESSSIDEGPDSYVLYVEDHDLSRSTTCALLEDEGIDIIGVATGAEALERTSDHPPAVLVVDLGLPDIAGPELASRLREQTPELPVVFVSGRGAGDPAVETAMELEGAQFLGKPFEIDELHDAIVAAIDEE